VSLSSDICISSAELFSTASGPAFSSQVQCVNPIERPGWDGLVGALPGCGLFQSAAWAKVLRETYRCNPHYFIVAHARRLAALLPVMEVNSFLSGRRGVALPFTDVCDTAGDESLLKSSLIPAAMECGRKRGWKYLEYRGGKQPFDPAACPFQSYWLHELDLFEDEKYLFARLESSNRRAIRKAQKLGLRVEFSQSLEALRRYYSLHCKTRKRHGLPPQPFAFFLNIYEHVLSQNKGVVALARHAEHVVAGAVYFQFNGQGIYKFGASDETFQDFRGNDLVMWEAIKWHARKGMKKLHFGRTSLGNQGLRRFKLGWGVEERQIEYIRYDFCHERYVSGRDNALGWHNSVFRRLPVFALRVLGNILYRHVA
jgi:CelD/BcsL family acetyltransferase involved in cellulose biosynthesis